MDNGENKNMNREQLRAEIDRLRSFDEVDTLTAIYFELKISNLIKEWELDI